MSTLPQRAEARAWCRVDLGGGTLDIWPLGLLHNSAVTVNVAIDLAVRVEIERTDGVFRVSQDDSMVEAASARDLRERPESALIGVICEHLGAPPVAVRVRSESPRGGGLGASSALVVALLGAGGALLGIPAPSARRTAMLARDLESQLMGLPTGVQDHFPALLGGALAVLHQPGEESVRPIDADLGRLGESLLVVYTGESHFSGGKNWQIIRRRLDGDAEIVELFDEIAAVAAEMPSHLEAGDLEGLGRLVLREWSLRQRLAPGISTDRIENLLELALQQGAWGGKACGAGGGGSILLLCPAEKRQQIAAELSAAGGRVLTARPAADRCRVETG